MSSLPPVLSSTPHAPAPPVVYVASAPPYRPMSVSDWVVLHLILCIPVAGIVMLFVWAFTDDARISRKTYCQAMLLIALFWIIVGILIFVAMAVFAGAIGVANHQ